VTKLDIIVERVNKAANFWADTKDVDYCAGLSLKEIKEYDKENFEDFFLFKKELSACGY
jgi:hypothetical protein